MTHMEATNDLVFGSTEHEMKREISLKLSSIVDYKNNTIAVKAVEIPPTNGPVKWPLRPANPWLEAWPTPEITTPEIENSASWHPPELIGRYLRFVPIAQAFAAMSKMPGTKVGCVILGHNREVLSSGWNGAPRGSKADTDDRLATRESRLDWVVHAEANAIANAARSGVTLDGATLICTLMPCMTCAKLIVQSGIDLVLCPAPGEDNARWGREFDLTRTLLDECNVGLVHYDTTGKSE